MGATGAIYDPKAKLRDAEWEGSPGSSGKVIQGEPIKHWLKKKKKKLKEAFWPWSKKPVSPPVDTLQSRSADYQHNPFQAANDAWEKINYIDPKLNPDGIKAGDLVYFASRSMDYSEYYKKVYVASTLTQDRNRVLVKLRPSEENKYSTITPPPREPVPIHVLKKI